jgi:hypothetical protein
MRRMNFPRSTGRLGPSAQAEVSYHVTVRWTPPNTPENAAELRRQIAAYQAHLGEHPDSKTVMIYSSLIGLAKGMLARHENAGGATEP